MKLGLFLGYGAKRVSVDMDLVKTAESLGFDSVWAAEAYGGDVISVASWILAQTEKIKVGTSIMQIPARTPACAAMTAMSLSQLSGGRFICGLGASGPQVVEGWHGVAYRKPVTGTREYIEIMRNIMAREGRLAYDGDIYQLPYTGPNATGLGKSLKSILEATPDIPIYTAAITPAGLACAAEVADGVNPVWMNPERFDLFAPSLEKGFAKVPGKSLADFDVAPGVVSIMADDVDACRGPVKGVLALYIGGMGARGKNFYNDYVVSLGYEDEARKIQDLYLDGNKEAAAAAVPDKLVDEVALIGPRERIIERAAAWKEAGRKNQVGTMMVTAGQPEVLALLADIFN
ncbi:MAG: LLM class F420-dependent oxidoreductase [Halieaceae bacterium]|nr:LLM class F420-dependent oxidoreductase [Halieaceae bacterium]